MQIEVYRLRKYMYLYFPLRFPTTTKESNILFVCVKEHR